LEPQTVLIGFANGFYTPGVLFLNEDPAASIALLPQKVTFTRKSITLETMNRIVEIQKQYHGLSDVIGQLLVTAEPLLVNQQETDWMVMRIDVRSSKSKTRESVWLN
jgi:hypothetical protein